MTRAPSCNAKGPPEPKTPPAVLTGFDPDELRDMLLRPAPDWEPDVEQEPSVVQVTLEVDPQAWNDVQTDLDRLVRRWGLWAHVKR